jgi:hypothetical protein
MDIPPILFENKFRLVNPVKLRTGSSVPVMAQRRNSARQHQHIKHHTIMHKS